MLSDQSIDRLKRRKDLNPDAAFVFPSPKSEGEPVIRNSASGTVSKNRDALGVNEGFAPHIVRHGLLTWMAGNQMSRDLRDRISNHRPAGKGVDAVYTSAADLNQLARQALQRWPDTLDGNETDDDIVVV